MNQPAQPGSSDADVISSGFSSQVAPLQRTVHTYGVVEARRDSRIIDGLISYACVLARSLSATADSSVGAVPAQPPELGLERRGKAKGKRSVVAVRLLQPTNCSAIAISGSLLDTPDYSGL